MPRIAFALLLGLMVANSAAAQRPSALRPVDFVVANISDSTDSAKVRALLGAPDSVTAGDHPNVAGGKLIDWWYPDTRISYHDKATVRGVWLLAAGHHTARGIALGDSRSRVRALYGAPARSNPDEDAWVYRDPSADDHLLKLWFSGGRVSRVFLGWTLD